MGVTNWLSPKVSNPEMVCEVELKGNASAKPRSELRDLGEVQIARVQGQRYPAKSG